MINHIISHILVVILINYVINHISNIVASVVISWDNLTSKGMGGISPDHAIAWNQSMKDELEQYHGVKPASIFVGGIAHFDDYYRHGATISREELLSGKRETRRNHRQ